MRYKTRKGCERSVTAAPNYPTNGEERLLKAGQKGDVWEALKSTLCFNKGCPLVLDVKLFVVGVCIYPVIPPHGRDATVRHHPTAPEAEAASQAAASLQRRQLDERT